MCRDEALQLSELQPRLAQANIPLIGMLHENIAKEVADFRPFFKVQNEACQKYIILGHIPYTLINIFLF